MAGWWAGWVGLGWVPPDNESTVCPAKWAQHVKHSMESAEQGCHWTSRHLFSFALWRVSKLALRVGFS